MSARGCALRSVAPHSIPSIRMSEEYSNSPLTFGMPSARTVGVADDPRPLDLGARGRPRRDGGNGRHTRASALAASRRLARAMSTADLRLVGGAQLAALDDRAPTHEQQLDRLRGAEDERRDGILDAGAVEAVEAPQRDVGELAGLERAELVVAAEAARAVDRGEGERLARRQRLRAAGAAGRTAAPRAARTPSRPPRSTRRRRRRGRRHAGADQPGDRCDAGAEPRVGARAVGDAGSGRAEAGDLGVVQVHAVGQPHVVAEPAELVEVVDGAHAEVLLTEALLVERLGQMGVQAHAATARQLGGIGHQPAA